MAIQPPPHTVRATGGAACSRICSRTAHNYLDGAGQNITIRTLARTTRPQVKPVLAGQGAYWQRVTCPTFNPAGRVRDPGGPPQKRRSQATKPGPAPVRQSDWGQTGDKRP